VAGIDVSYDKGSDWLFAAIVVMRIPDLHVIETASTTALVPLPLVNEVRRQAGKEIKISAQPRLFE